MSEQDEDQIQGAPGSLEHTDVGESMRQLWWTIGVTLAGVAIVAYFTL